LKLSLHNTKENGVAKIKQIKTIGRRNMTMFPIVYHVMSHNIGSIPTKDTTVIAG
jgi:molybdopterin synthase catalytic subunit